MQKDMCLMLSFVELWERKHWQRWPGWQSV